MDWERIQKLMEGTNEMLEIIRECGDSHLSGKKSSGLYREVFYTWEVESQEDSKAVKEAIRSKKEVAILFFKPGMRPRIIEEIAEAQVGA